MCSDDNDTKCSKLLRASLRGTSGSQDTVIDYITAILYVSVKCVQCNQKIYIYITINSVPYQYFGLLTM